MIKQVSELNTERAYHVSKVEQPKNETVNPVANDRKVPEDVLTISENGTIDLKLFNFLDKGGDASKALPEKSKEDGRREGIRREETRGEESPQEGQSFSARPDFRSVSAERYLQMRAEIERNFADDPTARSKYLRELEKAREDYDNLQAKIEAALSIRKEDGAEPDIFIKADGEAQEDEEEKGEAEKSEESKTETENTRKLLDPAHQARKAVVERFAGRSEDSSDKMTEAVDDFLLKDLAQKTKGATVKDALNQDVNRKRA